MAHLCSGRSGTDLRGDAMLSHICRAWWPALLLAGWCSGPGALLAQPGGKNGQKIGDMLPPPKTVASAPSTGLLGPQVSPIDLPSALRLAGVQNPEILLAQERVEEAAAL